MIDLQRFQPTLPARGATIFQFSGGGAAIISTHAPRTGSDLALSSTLGEDRKFQPTLPARGATDDLVTRMYAYGISTHAPRTGSDMRWCMAFAGATDFNPRSPHGERRQTIANESEIIQFQPTLPARGATVLWTSWRT